CWTTCTMPSVPIAPANLAPNWSRQGERLQFQLRQVRAMIFAVAILHQAVWFNRVIAIGGGAVEAALLHGDLVNLTGAFPQIGFQGIPVGIVKPAEEDTEAVIGTFDGPKRLIQECLEEMRPVGGPL